MDNQAYSANFSQSGEWTETEYNIGESAIPENIKALLDANFTDYEVETAEIAETAEGTSYEFEIEAGENDWEVMIDPQGNLTQKQLSEENEDKD